MAIDVVYSGNWDRSHMADLYSVGVTFHSCGCSGPGYIHKDKSALILHLEQIKENYIHTLRQWINYVAPEAKKEKELKKQKGDYLHPSFELKQQYGKTVTKEIVRLPVSGVYVWLRVTESLPAFWVLLCSY